MMIRFTNRFCKTSAILRGYLDGCLVLILSVLFDEVFVIF